MVATALPPRFTFGYRPAWRMRRRKSTASEHASATAIPVSTERPASRSTSDAMSAGTSMPRTRSAEIAIHLRDAAGSERNRDRARQGDRALRRRRDPRRGRGPPDRVDRAGRPVKPTRREISILSVSAIDLFASALGAFVVVAFVLLPYFPNTGDAPAAPGNPAVRSVAASRHFTRRARGVACPGGSRGGRSHGGTLSRAGVGAGAGRGAGARVGTARAGLGEPNFTCRDGRAANPHGAGRGRARCRARPRARTGAGARCRDVVGADAAADRSDHRHRHDQQHDRRGGQPAGGNRRPVGAAGRF